MEKAAFHEPGLAAAGPRLQSECVGFTQFRSKAQQDYLVDTGTRILNRVWKDR